MSKTIPFRQPEMTKPAEQWVQTGEGDKTTAPVGPTKRLTVDIPEDLHRRIKIQCAKDTKQISDVVRDILIKIYPPEAAPEPES